MPRIVDHAQRRSELVDVTAREIARVGLDGVRLRGVGERAGWTTGAVSHYFADKRALLLATFRSRRSYAAQAIDEALAGGATELEAIIEAVLPVDEERCLNWSVWLAFWGAAVGDAELAEEQRRRYDEFCGSLRTAVRTEQQAGRLPAHLRPADEARRLAALLDGIAVQAIFAPTLWPPATQRRFVADHLATLQATPPVRS
jgi:AcrR family transcriptional regulator